MQRQSSGGLHVAIIMDGNGRWANARGLPRVAGHRAGVDTVRRVVETAPSLGISVLTLYAFSADNWQRPPREVSALMRIFGLYLNQEANRCIAQGVRLKAIGRRDRLPASVVRTLEETERRTSGGRTLQLRLAVDYSSRHAILEAASHAHRSSLGNGLEGQATANNAPMLTEEAISRHLGPPVDLLIRTSGEQRLSDFLLWESAYAEIVFTPRMWPDFSPDDFAAAVTEFHSRDRRYGAIQTASLRSA